MGDVGLCCGMVRLFEPDGEMTADDSGDAAADRINGGETANDEAEGGDRINLRILLDVADIGAHPGGKAGIWIGRCAGDVSASTSGTGGSPTIGCRASPNSSCTRTLTVGPPSAP